MVKTDVGLANAIDVQQRTAALVVITICGRLHQHMYFQSSARRNCSAAIWSEEQNGAFSDATETNKLLKVHFNRVVWTNCVIIIY